MKSSDNIKLKKLLIRAYFTNIIRVIIGEKNLNKILYRLKLKKGYPNLDNPKTFSEKLLYLKMYYENPLLITCVDKYNVQKYVSLMGLEKYLKKVYAVYNSPNEINEDDLPDKCFIQMTHMSQFNYVYDKNDKNSLKHIKKIFKKLMKYNHYWLLGEKPYKYVKPKIICSEFLEEKNKLGLTDYKFYCFDGEVKYFMVSYGEFEHNTQNVKFDRNWNSIDNKFKKQNNLDYKNIKKPENFETMIEIAEKLSKDFPHVRVDLYNIEGRIIFGEMTFFSSGGFVKVYSKEMDNEIGSWIDLDKYKEDIRIK